MLDLEQTKVNNYVYCYNLLRQNPDLFMSGLRGAEETFFITADQQLNYNLEQIYCISFGALLREIGKIKIPQSIVNKRTKLLPEEEKLLKTHVDLGSEIVSPIKSYYISNIVKMHHENLDGSGYGENLTYSDIPLYVQVVAVADRYEALTHARMYRPAFNHEEAIKILRKEADEGKINKDFVNSISRINSQKESLRILTDMLKGI